MKRNINSLGKFVLIILTMSIFAVFTLGFVTANASEASASSRINFYNQHGVKYDSDGNPIVVNNKYVPKDEAKKYPYELIEVGQNKTDSPVTCLGAAGCSLFSGLHAYQWLFGRFNTLDEQTRMAQQIADTLHGDRPDEVGATKAKEFLVAAGAKPKKVDNSENAIKDFFDTTNGVLCHNVPGHYFVSIGYTYHEIGGVNTFLLHVVDSSNGTAIRKGGCKDKGSLCQN